MGLYLIAYIRYIYNVVPELKPESYACRAACQNISQRLHQNEKKTGQALKVQLRGSF